MLEAYGEAIRFLFSPAAVVILLIGITLGNIVGVIPGIGGIMLAAITLPFLFKMPAEVGLLLLIAMISTTPTGGSISAVLIGIPGVPPCAATVLDGYPMTQKGEGARACGAALTASLFGGVVPVVLALVMIPLIMPILMAFGQPEMAILVLMGISFMAVLTGGSATRGIIAGMFGILVSLVGFHGLTGAQRFTFNSLFLYDGLELMAVVTGLFGLEEMFSLLAKGQATLAEAPKTRLSDVLRGAKDVWIHRWLWARCSLIGYIIGVIPGIGGDTAMFVTYGHAKQTSKHPEEFGTGRVEGVIAPETANNAKESGALLTTMAFGIPGSAVCAVLIGGFLMVGVVPGPRMMIDNLPLVLTLLVGTALANVLGGLQCIFSMTFMAKVARVNIDYLFVAITVVAFVGIYSGTLGIGNLIVAILFALVGFFMKKYNYSRAAFVLGFVLGEQLELYSMISFKLFGPLFWTGPISLTLIALTLLMVFYPNLKKAATGLRRRPRTV